MGREKCIVLDYEKEEVRVIDVDSNDTGEDVEMLLTNQYGYSLNGIEFMKVSNLKLIIE